MRYSRRQERRSRSISRLFWGEADRRDDLLLLLLLKASTAVARSTELVVVERLNLAGLLRNRSIARSPSEATLGQLLGMMRYKTEKLGGLFLPAPRFFASTKHCASCSALNAELTLDDRSWICPSCGTVRDRDWNAENNLRQLGPVAAMDGPVPDGLRSRANWIEDARASAHRWLADCDGSGGADRGGSPRRDAQGQGSSGAPG